MKSKNFKKMRKIVNWYYVQKSTSLFGSFSNTFPLKTVLAVNSKQALKRYFKRNNIYSSIVETNESSATYKVIPVNKPYLRFAKYYFI